jgi:hypothetical protein
MKRKQALLESNLSEIIRLAGMAEGGEDTPSYHFPIPVSYVSKNSNP